jgi:hypothetical protein
MAVCCGECGVRLACRARLAGHFRRAHGGRRVRPSGVRVPPVGARSLSARGVSVPSRPGAPAGLRREIPPSWWATEMPDEWRRSAWAHFPVEVRKQILADGRGRPAPAATGRISSPDPLDAAALWSLYEALKALAVRLDVGLGTEEDRIAFERWLHVYDGMFERVRSRRPLL